MWGRLAACAAVGYRRFGHSEIAYNIKGDYDP
jgi:hypothetical protein